MVRIWNSVTGQYRVTPKGEDYYRNNRQDFVFQIPVIAWETQKAEFDSASPPIRLSTKTSSTTPTRGATTCLDSKELDEFVTGFLDQKW